MIISDDLKSLCSINMLHQLACTGAVGAGGNGCLLQTAVGGGGGLVASRSTDKRLAALREGIGNPASKSGLGAWRWHLKRHKHR